MFRPVKRLSIYHKKKWQQLKKNTCERIFCFTVLLEWGNLLTGIISWAQNFRLNELASFFLHVYVFVWVSARVYGLNVSVCEQKKWKKQARHSDRDKQNNIWRESACLWCVGWRRLFRHLLMIFQMGVGDREGRVLLEQQKLHCPLSKRSLLHSF